MKNQWLALLLVFFSAISGTAWAEKQDHARIKAVALSFLQQQSQKLPGQATIQVQDLDTRTQLRACNDLQAFMPSGAQAIGHTSVGVRCNEPRGWSVFLQANIRIKSTVLVSVRPLSQNTVLTPDDFSLQDMELGQTGLLTDPAQAIGKTLKFGIGAGQVLRTDMLRSSFVISQGKNAEVRVIGNGFSVRSSGQALNNASEGQAVQVRMPSGQVVSGTATADGNVEVRP